MDNCKHLNFKVDATVNRIAEDKKVEAGFYDLNLTVKCADCDMGFKFCGVKHGWSAQGPTVSVDDLELRCPMVPDDGAIHLPSKLPGFTVGVDHGGPDKTVVTKLRGDKIDQIIIDDPTDRA